MINKIVYLGYYILNTPKSQFFKDFNYVKKKKKISALSLYTEVLFSSFRYNISLMDYFKLRFFDKTKQQRTEYAGMGFMYEYQLKMNPKAHRDVLENKVKFLERFKEFSGRKWATLNMLNDDNTLLQNFINNEHKKVVLKYSKGQAGQEVKVISTEGISPTDLLTLMKSQNFDLIETFVVQHDELMRIAPRGLNTVRIVTQLSGNNVIIIGTSLRLSIYENVDNMRAGNIALPLDPETGITTDAGVYADISKDDVKIHPLTGLNLIGFQVPFWKECREMITKAALITPENKSIGWDVAITNKGPLLIEGNHNWSHELWQLPVRKGQKQVLLQFMKDSTT